MLEPLQMFYLGTTIVCLILLVIWGLSRGETEQRGPIRLGGYQPPPQPTKGPPRSVCPHCGHEEIKVYHGPCLNCRKMPADKQGPGPWHAEHHCEECGAKCKPNSMTFGVCTECGRIHNDGFPLRSRRWTPNGLEVRHRTGMTHFERRESANA